MAIIGYARVSSYGQDLTVLRLLHRLCRGKSMFAAGSRDWKRGHAFGFWWFLFPPAGFPSRETSFQAPEIA